MASFDVWNPIMNFVTILLLTFALFLVITGAFTAYFGSGKSRKIGVGLLVGGLVVGDFWAWYAGRYNAAPTLAAPSASRSSCSSPRSLVPPRSFGVPAWR